MALCVSGWGEAMAEMGTLTVVREGTVPGRWRPAGGRHGSRSLPCSQREEEGRVWQSGRAGRRHVGAGGRFSGSPQSSQLERKEGVPWERTRARSGGGPMKTRRGGVPWRGTDRGAGGDGGMACRPDGPRQVTLSRSTEPSLPRPQSPEQVQARTRQGADPGTKTERAGAGRARDPTQRAVIMRDQGS